MSDTVQLSDQFLVASSLKSDPEVRMSKGKKVVSVSDLNQGSYQSGLITIDATNQLNGSQGFASLREAYLTVPYIVTAKNTGANDLGTAISRFIVAPKCGVWNFISDLECELNGKQILTTNEYKNFWNNVRAMTEISQVDIAKHGSDMFLAPDDWTSINFAAAAGGNGDGYANNSLDSSAKFDAGMTQAQEPKAYNSGFNARVASTPMPIDATTNASFGWPTLNVAAQKQIAQQSGRGCWLEYVNAANNRGSAGNINGVWVYMLKIRLADLHPLFKELDLVANPQLKLRYRVNAGTTSVVGSGAANQFSLVSTTMTSGNVCPIMVSAAGSTNEPMNGVFGTSVTTLSVAFGPLQNQFTTTASIGDVLPYTTTRLNIPFYDLVDPRPIISKPIKTVRYLDCFAQYFKQRAGLGVTAGQQNAAFNFQLSASLKNVKYIAMIPFAETSSGHWATAHGTEQFQSPFDSAPWTCQPGASVRNFQVQLGNSNVFAKTHEYDYESFMDEFSKLGCINGDVTREMNSGLVDLDHWTYAQRIMVADCSRISDKDVPASIQVSGINSCSQGSNYLILAVYERSLELDRLTGEVVSFD